MINKGCELKAQGRYKEAISNYDKVLEINSNNIASWNNKGECLNILGRIDEALNCLDKALETDPQNVDALNNKGISLSMLGRLDEALSCFNKAIEFDSQKIASWFNKGKVLKILGKNNEAIQCFDRVLDLDTKNADSWNIKGLCLDKLQYFNEALVCFEDTLKINPKDGLAWTNKGNTLKKLGRIEESIFCYDTAININPLDFRFWYNKAIAEDEFSRRRHAIQSYKQFILLAPTSLKSQIENANQRIRELGAEKNSIRFKESFNISRNKGDFIGSEYQIYGTLGEGGFGIVYLVYSHRAGHAIALKTFKDEYLSSPKIIEQFQKEAKIWVKLEEHTYIVQAYFVTEIAGRLYIAMEYIVPNSNGLNTLSGYLNYNFPDLQQSLHWAIQFCQGMEYAYSKGIRCHRDIKPSNIMISHDMKVKISDFGLAGVLHMSKEIQNSEKKLSQEKFGINKNTLKGAAIGTHPYMPPEQFIDVALCDERSDIYSFGIVLYQMVTKGELSFIGPNWEKMYLEFKAREIKFPLFPIIQRCLAKNPDERYQSFEELRKSLEPFLVNKLKKHSKHQEVKDIEAFRLSDKAISLKNLGLYDEAIECLNKALEMNPQLAAAWDTKGNVLKRLRHYNEALDCFDKAIRINPQDKSVWINKGALLHDYLGKPNEAIYCFDKALEIDSKDTTALGNKGIALSNIGKYDDAIYYFDRALEIFPQDATVWNNKGCCFKDTGRYNAAIECFEKALLHNPLLSFAWFNMGSIFEILSNYQKAIQCFDKGLQIDPKNINAISQRKLIKKKFDSTG